MIGKDGFVVIYVAKVFGIRSPNQFAGVSVESDTSCSRESGRVEFRVFFEKSSHDLPVLWSRDGFVDLRFPAQEVVPGILNTLYGFQAFLVDSILRFDAEDFGVLSCGGPALEPFADRAATELQVLLDLVAGDELGSAEGIEAATPLVAGQGADIHGDSQNLLDGVLILPTVEATHGDLAAGIGKGTTGSYHGLSERVKEIRLLRVARLLGVFGRHYASVQCIENLLPEFCLLDGRDAQRQRFEINFPILRRRVVTIEAVCLEKCTMFLRKPCIRGGSRRKAAKAQSCRASCVNDSCHIVIPW